MNGWELKRALDDDWVIPRPPILLLTGVSDPARTARDLGVEGFIAKPFDIGHILDVVSRRPNGKTSEPRLPGSL